MEQILSEYTVSITELRKAPGELLKQAAGQTVEILNNSKLAPLVFAVMVTRCQQKECRKVFND